MNIKECYLPETQISFFSHKFSWTVHPEIKNFFLSISENFKQKFNIDD